MPSNTALTVSNSQTISTTLLPAPCSVSFGDNRPTSDDREMHDLFKQRSTNAALLLDMESGDNPMLNAQQERPSHYAYLKEFRVDPCPLFKQHQCTNHRPYSCFYWHFANQRRRRPIRRKDGTFNYSADFYCAKYDENTGICPDGDECPYLHRVYGDVERKYHLRYYKTALCVHPTDAKGHCSKNGAHCAFAHGPEDIRNPIFDIRELQHCGELNGESIDNRDRLNFVVEDPVWQDQAYVLVNYKTEPCKKPPRLCRQGYACPYYHGGKDKRRKPHKQSDGNTDNAADSDQNGSDSLGALRYRSTPCPNVKRADEWGDPDICEAGDNCPYCHTRTEQQFHPEIYKSTKCNDMLQHGYCPRGPFCAFAHTDGELHGERKQSVSTKRPSISASNNDSNTNTITFGSVSINQFKSSKPSGEAAPVKEGRRRMSAVEDFTIPTLETPVRKNSLDQFCFSAIAVNGIATTNGPEEKNASFLPSYSAVLKQRHNSGSTGNAANGNSSSGSSLTGSPSPPATHAYPKAPGFEREQHSPPRPWPAALMNESPLSSGSFDFLNQMQTEASRIKSNLYLHHEIGCDLGGIVQEQQHNQNGLTPTTPPTPSSMRSNSFSPFSTGSIWQHHSHSDDDHGGILDEFTLPPISEKDERGVDSGTNLLNFYTSNANGSTSLLVPRTRASTFGGHENNALSIPFSSGILATANSGRRNSVSTNGEFGNGDTVESRHTEEEIASLRFKLATYEDCVKRARLECETWKREALENKYRAEIAEQERSKAEQDRDRANTQFVLITNELKALQLSGLWPLNTDLLSPIQLEQIRMRLRTELEKIDRQLQQRLGGPVCARCGRHVNGNALPGTCPVCATTCKSNGHHQQILTT